MKNPVVLCILDGWGLRAETANNAVALSNTPTYDHLMATCPNATLKTSGRDVGLPDGQMGNSEVGHMNIGAGRVVAMDLGKIGMAIEDGSYVKNPVLLEFAAKLKASKGRAHLMGLVSDGGVHAHMDHLIATADFLSSEGIEVLIHVWSDGRDVAPGSIVKDIATLEKALSDKAQIATLSGRYFAMDRDLRWERIEQAYRAMVHGQGRQVATTSEAIACNEGDEFILPSVLNAYAGMTDGDGVLCLNFRADRAREIMSALGDPSFDAFDIANRPKLAAMTGMSSYSTAHDTYMSALYRKDDIPNTLGEWVAKHAKTQFRLAETEKYPHVTFFLNGGVEPPNEGEDRNMPKSPKVATYDLQPEMSAPEVTDQFESAIEHGYDLIVVNYANPDMVGHTGDLAAAIKACEAVDNGLGRAVAALEKAGGAMIVTADHGNCETMVDPETGMPHTAHTTNPVPVILVGGGKNTTLRDGGRLADLAPTLLQLMDLPQPAEMTGETLIA